MADPDILSTITSASSFGAEDGAKHMVAMAKHNYNLGELRQPERSADTALQDWNAGLQQFAQEKGAAGDVSAVSAIAAQKALNGYDGGIGNEVTPEIIAKARQDFIKAYDHRNAAAVNQDLMTSLRVPAAQAGEAGKRLDTMSLNDRKLLDQHLRPMRAITTWGDNTDIPAGDYAKVLNEGGPADRPNLLQGADRQALRDVVSLVAASPVNPNDPASAFVAQGAKAALGGQTDMNPAATPLAANAEASPVVAAADQPPAMPPAAAPAVMAGGVADAARGADTVNAMPAAGAAVMAPAPAVATGAGAPAIAPKAVAASNPYGKLDWSSVNRRALEQLDPAMLAATVSGKLTAAQPSVKDGFAPADMRNAQAFVKRPAPAMPDAAVAQARAPQAAPVETTTVIQASAEPDTHQIAETVSASDPVADRPKDDTPSAPAMAAPAQAPVQTASAASPVRAASASPMPTFESVSPAAGHAGKPAVDAARPVMPMAASLTPHTLSPQLAQMNTPSFELSHGEGRTHVAAADHHRRDKNHTRVAKAHPRRRHPVATQLAQKDGHNGPRKTRTAANRAGLKDSHAQGAAAAVHHPAPTQETKRVITDVVNSPTKFAAAPKAGSNFTV